MSLASWRNELLDHGQVIGIVEDEQPVGTIGQPGFDRLNYDYQIWFILLWKIQQMSNGHKRGDQFLLLIGTDPQNGMIVLTIPIGIFDRQLRFANSTQSSDSIRLRQHGLLLTLQH